MHVAAGDFRAFAKSVLNPVEVGATERQRDGFDQLTFVGPTVGEFHSMVVSSNGVVRSEGTAWVHDC